MAVFEKRIADTTMSLAHFVIPADFDGDGDLDLVATSEGTNVVAWYEHDGGLYFTKQVIDANLVSAYPVSVADLDRDGDPTSWQRVTRPTGTFGTRIMALLDLHSEELTSRTDRTR